MLTCIKYALILAVGLTVSLQGEVDEYRVKAFFLYNFARYVEWPAQKFKGPNDPFVICILGKSPFSTSLQDATAGKLVDGRPFVVFQGEMQPSRNCHILFVTSSERKQFRSMAESLNGAGVLTVGEGPGFTADGGVINFKLENSKVRFEINVEAAERQHLRVSSRLLALAQAASR